MNDITPKEAIEILRHYTNLGYGIVIEGEDTSKIKQALSLANKALANGTPYNPQGEWQGGELGHCTNCGHKGSASDIWNNCTGMFCPNCGAELTNV